MKDLLNIQIRLFGEAWTALCREELQLRNDYQMALSLAGCEWSEGIVPSPSGGYSDLCPNKMIPDRLDLLDKNFQHRLENIRDRKCALCLVYEPIMRKAKRPFLEDQKDLLKFAKAELAA